MLVGDRDVDVRGAAAHDVDCIGAAWGYGGAAELRAAVEPALRLAGVHRYGSWLRLLVYADDESMRTYAPLALQYLRTLADPVVTAG